MFLLSVIASVPAAAQYAMPSILDNGNAGTEFTFSMPPCYEQGGSNNMIVVYVSSAYQTDVTVSVPGRGVSRTEQTQPGLVTIFTMSASEAQPFNKNANQEAPAQALYTGAAVVIKSDKPIVAYCVTRFQFTTDGVLLTPNASLGTEYVVGSMADMSQMYPGLNLPSEATVCAIADGTRVWFTLGGGIETVANNGLESGQTKEYVMNKGDVLAISTINQGGDLSGSYVRADKPVAVLSGNQCANVPTNIRWCDYIVSSEPPLHTWGKVYHFPQLGERNQNAWMKIFAAEANATILRNGQIIDTIETAKGGRSGVGYLEGQAMDGEQQPIVFTSDKPISVKFFNPGQELDNLTTDPSSIQITPVDQYVNFVWFCSPGVAQLQFAENFISIVYATDEDGVIPADLEFGVFEDGALRWNSVRNVYGSVPGSIFPSIGDGKTWAEKRLSLPNPSGVYAFRCQSSTFAAYSYGRQEYDTYAFRTGARMLDLTISDTRPPQNNFDSGEDQASGRIFDVGGAGLAVVRIIPETVENLRLIVDDFTPGTPDEVNWTAAAVNPDLPATARVAMIDRRGNSATFDIGFNSETRGTLQVTPRLLSFGETIAADVVERAVNIANVSQEAPLQIESIRFESGLEPFEFVNMPELPLVLPPAGDGAANEFELGIRFTGREVGIFNERLLIKTELEFENAHTRLVSTTNVTTLGITPQLFVPTVIDSRVDLTFLFNIQSTVEAEIVSVSQPDDPAFTIVRFTGALQSAPGTIPVGAVGGINVQFAPTEIKQYSATMDVQYRFGQQEARTATVNLLGEGIDKVSEVGDRRGFIDLAGVTQPSPAGPQASVRFKLDAPLVVSMKVYDLRGNTAVNIAPRTFEIGLNNVEIDLAHLAVGTYFLQLEAPGVSAVLPLVLMR